QTCALPIYESLWRDPGPAVVLDCLYGLCIRRGDLLPIREAAVHPHGRHAVATLPEDAEVPACEGPLQSGARQRVRHRPHRTTRTDLRGVEEDSLAQRPAFLKTPHLTTEDARGSTNRHRIEHHASARTKLQPQRVARRRRDRTAQRGETLRSRLQHSRTRRNTADRESARAIGDRGFLHTIHEDARVRERPARRVTENPDNR